MSSFSNEDRPCDYGSLVICATCFKLRGPVPHRTDGVEQLCLCTPLEVRQDTPLWPRDYSSAGGSDFNQYAELCRCCALVLLPSGSRFSCWFCQRCKALVRAFNDAAGAYLVPIGRHSFQAGVALRGDQFDDPAAIEAFVASTRALVAGIGGTEGIARAAVQRNLLALELDTSLDIYVAKYLWAIRGSTLTPEDGFAHLVASIGNPEVSA